MADYWTPPVWSIDKQLRTTFESLRRALNSNLDSVFSSVTSLLSFQTNAESAWTTYTPSDVNVTVGNGVRVAEYKQIGKTVHVRYNLTFGSTTTLGASFCAIGLPVAGRARRQYLGGFYEDNGTRNWLGAATIGSGGSTGLLIADSGGSLVSSTLPFTWTTGDAIVIEGTYESA